MRESIRLTILTFSILFFSISVAQMPVLDEKDFTMNIQPEGKVKSVETITYEAVLDSTKKIVKGVRTAVPAWNHTFKFNSEGNVTEVYTYDEKGEVLHIYKFNYNTGLKREVIKRDSEGNEVAMFTYEYDSLGRETEYAVHKNDKVVVKLLSTYDSLGNKIKSCKLESNRPVLCEGYRYNRKGYVVEVEREEAGKEKIIYRYSYDIFGNNIGELIYKGDSTFSSRTMFFYDGKGLLDFESQRNADGKEEYKINFGYDKEGNLTDLRYESRTLNSMQRFEYNYDERGNIIERLELLDNKPMYLVEKSITYYD